MSREEVVFTKRAIIAVSAMSVIASNIVIGFMAAMWLWRFSDQLEAKTTQAATKAAIAALQPVREEFLKIGSDSAVNGKDHSRFEDEIRRLETRQNRLEDAMNAAARRRHGD